MPVQLSPSQAALFNAKNFGHIASVFPDGSVQVTPIWVDSVDGRVRINSAEGRAKVKNLRRNPQVTIEVSSEGDPYEYVEVRGRVVEMTHEGADDHIDALAKKYLDVDSYPYRKADEQRVTIVIEPEKVLGNRTGSAAKSD
jgi:PPOX class probable F420-dependent enzyme